MSKRHDGLFERIANFRALKASAKRAILGKRRKSGASAFYANLERELLRLERELNSGAYRPGRYVEIPEILVRDPKERMPTTFREKSDGLGHKRRALLEKIDAAIVKFRHSFTNFCAQSIDLIGVLVDSNLRPPD